VWRCNGRTPASASSGGGAESKLRGATFVVVMQAADVCDLDDRAAGWRLCNPRDGSILLQREVSAPLVIQVDNPTPIILSGEKSRVPYGTSLGGGSTWALSVDYQHITC
jgi:hypothetical protein